MKICALRGWASPADPAPIAAAGARLLTPKSSDVDGQTLRVDSGMMIDELHA